MTDLPAKSLLRPDEVALTDLPDKKLLRVSEAAIYFGLHERTIRGWIKSGKLSAEKLVGSVRISRESIINLRLSGVSKNN